MPALRPTAPALCALLPLLAAACAEPSTARHPPAATTSSAAIATPAPALPDLPPGSIALAPAAAEPLPYALLAIDGARGVLAVSDAADEPVAYLQRVEVGGAAHDPVALVGHHPFYAWDEDGATMLISTRARSICLSRIEGSATRTLACHDEARADAVVRVGDRALLVAAEPEETDEDDETAKEKKRAEAQRRANEAKRRAAKKRKGRERARAPTGTDVLQRRKLEITTRGISAGGDLDDEVERSDVVFEEPMAGMGIVGAGRRTTADGTATRIDVVFHEWSGPITDRKAKAVGRARIGVAVLDERGAFVEGSRGKLGDGDLFFGFLADVLEPRIFTGEHGTVLLAQGSVRGPCQATVVTPTRAPMFADRDACAFDPERYLARAAELRGGVRPSSIEATDPAFRAMAAALTTSGARRAEGQPAWDAPRAVVAGRTGFTTTASGDLAAFDRTSFEVARLARPLVASRARAYEAAIASDGEALVRTHAGLRLVTAGGEVRAIDDGASSRPERRDARELGGSPFAKIGSTWWTTRDAPRRVVPSEAALSPLPGAIALESSVLVGGPTRGLLLRLDGEALAIATVGATGRVDELRRGASPVRGAIDAIGRDDGGALLVGASAADPRSWTAVAIEPDGTWTHGPIGERREALVPRLTAVAGHGARLQLGGTHLLLDARGQVKGTWRPDRAPGACIDGSAWPPRLPAPKPGTFVDVPALAGDSPCVVGQPTWSADGVLRVVVSRHVGLHASVELARYEPGPGERASLFAPADAARTAPGAAPQPAPSPRCPPDMVRVDERLCVDRFEASIAERATGRLASPDYPITPNLFASVLGEWATKRERVGDLYARALPLPRPAPHQAEGVRDPVATSRTGVLPSGYLTGLVAKEVCASAGKRLCTKAEFETACKGEKRTRFPYGDTYREGACNVARPGHPAASLHGHASVGHLDPRLGRVVLDETGPGLRPTGATPACASRWGGDAIYDMVGNLDEWLDEKGGAFAGGFYARGSKSGCDAIVDSHPPTYLDYSTGVRCCRDAGPG